ncbi:MAG: hypothetical protein SGJ21_04575 [Alphaproteobacteria bacterium]|nr:hypothetical protein [Alphaproteobacteria bacterium]
MQRFLLTLAFPLVVCAAAFAEPVTVYVPRDTASAASAEAYVGDLMEAVDKVCREETGPLAGLGYWSYRACRKATMKDVALREPTGLLAARLGLKSPVQYAGK